MDFKAIYFDGITSAARDVTVRRRPDQSLMISGKEIVARTINQGEFSILPLTGRSPVKIKLKDGGMVEIPYSEAATDHFRKNAGFFERIAGKTEKRPTLILSISVLAILFSIFIYKYGLNIAVKAVRPLVSVSVKDKIANHIMGILEGTYLHQPPVSKDRKLSALMQEINPKDELNLDVKIMHRSMRGINGDKEEVVNAFALLPRTIVVTEGLIKPLSDSQVQAIIAHELGHLVYDHGTQNLLRSSMMSLASLALFGADPGIFNTIAISLFEASYSQEQESEADKFAVYLLKKHGKNPRELASALIKIDTSKPNLIEKYLSSHPATQERARVINELAAN